MTIPRDDSGYSSSLAPSSFRLVTVLSLCMLSLVCVVLAVVMILFSNVNIDISNTVSSVVTDNKWLEMLYKLPLQLVIPSVVGGCVHWVALQLYLHN